MKVNKSTLLTGFFLLMFTCKPWTIGAASPPDVASGTPAAQGQDSLPKLKTLLLNDAPFLTPASDSLGVLRLPPVPRGFFCKFEDKMQQKWKIPLNLELK